MKYALLSGYLFTSILWTLTACSQKDVAVDPSATAEENLVLAKTGSDGLTAIDGSTGAIKWQISDAGQFALDAKTLFVNVSKITPLQAFEDTTSLYARQDTIKNLSVINAATGRISLAVKSELKPGYMVGCCGTLQSNELLKVSDGVAYMGLREVDFGITFRYRLFASEAKTGKLKWKSGIDIGSPATLHISEDKLYVGSSNGSFILDSKTGQILREHPSAQMPVVTDNYYLLYTEESLTVLDKKTGLPKWTYPTGQYMVNPPSVANGMVFLADKNKKLLAVDLETGAKKWEYLIENSDRLSSSAQVMNGILYVSNPNGRVYALDALTGTKKWQVWAGDGLYMAPGELIAKNNRLYVSVDYKKLLALDPLTGQKAWEVDFSKKDPSNLLTSFKVFGSSEIDF